MKAAVFQSDLFVPDPPRIWFDGVHLVLDFLDRMERHGDGWRPIGGAMDHLHAFAARVGLRRKWFQDASASHPHYDVTTNAKAEAVVRAGAVLVDAMDLAILTHAPGTRIRGVDWKPSILTGDLPSMARQANLMLMKRFAPGRVVGSRGYDHLIG